MLVAAGQVKCQHSKKAVNINTIRKVLKQAEFSIECTVSTQISLNFILWKIILYHNHINCI